MPFLDVTLFFVSSDRDALSLVEEGITRGRIWTVNELMDLYSIPDLQARDRMTVVSACALFDGQVVFAKKAKEAKEAIENTEVNPWSERSEKSERRGSDGH